MAKMTNPGILQVRRFESRGFYVADMIYDTLSGFHEPPRVVEPIDAGMVRTISNTDSFRPFGAGAQKRGVGQAASFASGDTKTLQGAAGKILSCNQRFLNPQLYLAGLEKSLFDLNSNSWAKYKLGKICDQSPHRSRYAK